MKAACLALWGVSPPGDTAILKPEVFMPAYLLLLVAVLSRLLPHAGWFNFTAVGGALLYFGARRSWREMLVPLAALIATDYALTVYSYHYTFVWQGYVPTWAWYLMAMALGQRAVGADLILRGLELCGLGGQRDLSALAFGAGHLLRRRSAVLSQRPALDRPGCRRRLRRSGVGAEVERNAQSGARHHVCAPGVAEETPDRPRLQYGAANSPDAETV
jgi:hypothetical protein